MLDEFTAKEVFNAARSVLLGVLVEEGPADVALVMALA